MNASPAPDGPGDAAGPDASPDVAPYELILVLRISKTTFYAARKAGRIPPPDRAIPGGYGRYSGTLAAKIAREAGRQAPKAWAAAS